MVHSSLGQRLIRYEWEASLPDVELSKTMRIKAQRHFQRGQFLLGVRDSSLPQRVPTHQTEEKRESKRKQKRKKKKKWNWKPLFVLCNSENWKSLFILCNNKRFRSYPVPSLQQQTLQKVGIFSPFFFLVFYSITVSRVFKKKRV